MAFTFGDVRRSLKKKGFTEESDRHHIYLRLYYQGKKTSIYTKCSHGADKDDVGHPLVTAMKLQLKLSSRKDLEDLVRCPMSAEQYIAILKEAGTIPK